MKITKYPQSCLKIEHDGKAILVDVGTLATAEYDVDAFGSFEAVLFTHSHKDHFDPDVLPKLAATGATIYGNANVAQLAGGASVEEIDEDEEFVIADFKIKAMRMEHCLMVDGSPAGIPNTGFLIDDQLLLPGDSTEDVGVKVEVVALPIFGPDISFKDAYAMLKQTQAKQAICIHYDVVGMDPRGFARLGGEITTLHTPKNEETVEI